MKLEFKIDEEFQKELGKFSSLEFFKPYISKAVEKSLVTIQANSLDFPNQSPYLFDFKVANVMAGGKYHKGYRTGFLANSLRDKALKEVHSIAFVGDKITAEVYSEVEYADYVAKENNFYERIMGYSTKRIDKHFEDAVKESLTK